MTLATILLLFSIFSTPSALPMVAQEQQTAPQSDSANKPAETSPAHDQGAAAPAQNPSTPSPAPSAAPPATAPEKTSSGQTPPKTGKQRRHKKRVVSGNCVSTPSPGGQSAAGPAPSNSGPPPTAAGSAATNCPPSKVIVQQGGTSDSSIQLAGGAGGTKSPQRDNANQMLAATEANLKKISGQQLNANQQDMVTQIRQFMQQSKAAVVDGDLERARTLAWKAQLLSDELVKPPQ
ncbi:MAG TPA: hypothetical protein VGK96_07815 [Candidatus Sulfotelmatobacter sp.]